MKKNRKFKLIKAGIGITVVATTLLTSSCGNSMLDKYYIVTDSSNNYLCTRKNPSLNTHDYEFYDIKDNTLIGVLCSKRGGNFDYSMHHIGTKFLNELQVIPLAQALSDEDINTSLFNKEADVNRLIDDDLLKDIVNNHFVKEEYHLTEEFKYIPSSKLQIFVHDNEIMIGYDVSPDRDFNKFRYIYSIEDMDVKEFDRNEEVKAVNIGIYLTDQHYRNNYITYNDAMGMISSYKINHHQKIKKIS